jgi:hypothetical protein
MSILAAAIVVPLVAVAFGCGVGLLIDVGERVVAALRRRRSR